MIGTFFPSRAATRLTADAKIRFKDAEISFTGALRVGVIVAGLIILLISLLVAGRDIFTTATDVSKDKVTEDSLQAIVGLIAIAGANPQASSEIFTSERIKQNPRLFLMAYRIGCDKKKLPDLEGSNMSLPKDTCDKIISIALPEIMKDGVGTSGK